MCVVCSIGLAAHLFVVELSGVHPDHDHSVPGREGPLEALQVREYVDAVNTAVREEVQDNNSTGQVASG